MKHWPHLCQVHAPWCGHCQMMAPDWEELGEYMSKQEMPGVDLTIAEVNCVENSVLCLKQGVDSYPSIKLYKPGLFCLLNYL